MNLWFNKLGRRGKTVTGRRSSGGNATAAARTRAVRSNLSVQGFEILEVRDLLAFSPFATVGGGSATWADYNNDGFTDVQTGGEGLWRNDGGTGFTNVGGGLNVGSWGDYDNDGFIDYVLKDAPYVYRNLNGTGQFASKEFPLFSPGPHEAVTFFDIEGDADLDIYVVGYEVDCCWSARKDDVNIYNSDTGEFEGNWTSPGAREGRGVTPLDFNEDQNIDIYVTNYRLQPNYLWQNDGSGDFNNFSNVANSLGATGGNGHGGGSAAGDFNNDGHMDIFAQNFSHPGQPQSRFLINRGPESNYSFENRGASGVGWVESYLTSAFGDVDNDGDLDLWITAVYGEAARLYLSNVSQGSFSFTSAASSMGLGGVGPTTQAAFADIDNDGDLDLLTKEGTVYANDAAQTSSNNWLRLKMVGDGVNVNTTALGTVVRADLGDGSILMRQVEGATGRANQNEQTLHFGLGSFTGKVPLEITWLDGSVHTLEVDPNQTVELSYSGLSVTTVDENGTATLTGVVSDPGSPFTLDVNWGDPLSPDNLEQFAFPSGTTSYELTHQYLDDNPSITASDTYNIDLTFSGGAGGTFSDSTTVVVNNVAPTLENLSVTTLDREGRVTLTGVIVDPGTLDNFSLELDWGDPLSSNNIQHVSFAPGTTSFALTHQYISGSDRYPIGLTITDDDTGSTSHSTEVPFVHFSHWLTLGGDAAEFADYNNDGFVDVSLGDGGLWRNDGGSSFTGWGTLGVGSWGDYNNDGFIDYINKDTLVVYRNNGDGTFYTFDIGEFNAGPHAAVTWFDMQGDADLDIYHVGFELDEGEGLYSEDRYDDVILYDRSADVFRHHFRIAIRKPGQGVTTLDFNEDQRIDVYVSNFHQVRNQLWENNGGGFGSWSSVTKAKPWNRGSGMGSAVGDFDNDGHIDIFVQNYSEPGQPPSALIRNLGPEGSYQFEDQQRFNGDDWVQSYSSAAVGDVDNDGDLDLFITALSSGDFSRLYENPGVGSSEPWNFTNVTLGTGLTGISGTSQAAFADIDNDGDLDLMTGGSLYTNDGNFNNWLRVKLTGDGVNVNTTALGTIVRADLGNGSILTRQVEGATGLANQNEQTLHFGLGSFTGKVPLEITWLDGSVHTLEVDPNQTLEVSYAYPRPSATSVDENGITTLSGSIPDAEGPFTLDVNWGDPLSPDNLEQVSFPPGTTSYELTHQYLDDNPSITGSDTYTIDLTFNGGAGGTFSDSVTVVVNNVAPTLDNLSVTTLDQDGRATLTGSIIDPGTLDTFVLEVNWGDPLSANNIQQVSFAAGTTSFALTHQYVGDGPAAAGSDLYPIGLTITDDDTGSTSHSTAVPGIRFSHLVTLGGDAAEFADYNNDGFVDVSLGDGGLWRNDGGSSFTGGGTLGVGSWGDYNNDGFIDYINKDTLVVYRNNGDGTFYTFDIGEFNAGPHAAVTWFDMQGDADLDIYHVGTRFEGEDLFSEDRYDDVILYDRSADVFRHHFRTAIRKPGQGVTTLDFNEDQRIDVYVSNFHQVRNQLWENNGGGFGSWSSVTKAKPWNRGSGMGSAVGDFDNDGHIDIFVQNYSEPGQPPSALIRNLGPEGSYQFEDQQRFNGDDWVQSYSSAAVGDVDNDGDLDLFITALSSGDFSRLYENPGVGSSEPWNFTNVTLGTGLTGISGTSQAAFADIDNDGDLDLMTGGSLYTNDGNFNNWLRVKLTGDGVNVNTTALGTIVRADLGNGSILTRQVEGATGLANQNEQTLHFGLGSFTGKVPLEITWLDGSVHTLEVDSNQTLELRYADLFFQPPRVTSVVVNRGAKTHDVLDSLAVTFDQGVVVSAADFSLQNDSAGGAPVDLSQASFSYDATLRTGTWDLQGLVSVAPGYHTVTLDAGGIRGITGVALDGNADGTPGDDFEQQILVAVRGDVNLDGKVDLTDFQTLTNHFDPSGQNPGNDWSAGNFDRDFDVDLSDFLQMTVHFAPQGYATLPRAVPVGSAGFTRQVALRNVGAGQGSPRSWEEDRSLAAADRVFADWRDPFASGRFVEERTLGRRRAARSDWTGEGNNGG